MDDFQKNINDILFKLRDVELQVARLVADSESEKETRKRITQILREDIGKVEKEVKDILYGEDRKSGMVVEVDRLNQEAIQRQQTKKNIYALWIAVGGLVIKELLTFLMKSK